MNKCARFTPPSTCQTLGTVDAPVPLSPSDRAANVCARLFPDEEVMQAACTARCADHNFSSPRDAQECAFQFAQTSRQVAPPTADDHALVWSVVLVLILVPAAWYAYQRSRKKPGKLEQPE